MFRWYYHQIDFVFHNFFRWPCVTCLTKSNLWHHNRICDTTKHHDFYLTKFDFLISEFWMKSWYQKWIRDIINRICKIHVYLVISKIDFVISQNKLCSNNKSLWTRKYCIFCDIRNAFLFCDIKSILWYHKIDVIMWYHKNQIWVITKNNSLDITKSNNWYLKIIASLWYHNLWYLVLSQFGIVCDITICDILTSNLWHKIDFSK